MGPWEMCVSARIGLTNITAHGARVPVRIEMLALQGVSDSKQITLFKENEKKNLPPDTAHLGDDG